MSESTDWQVYDWETDRVRGVTRDELYDTSDLIRATAPSDDWPEDLEVAPTPHEWQVDGRAATPAELQDWGARARAGQHRPESLIPAARPTVLPSEATAKAALPVTQAAVKARLTQ